MTETKPGYSGNQNAVKEDPSKAWIQIRCKHTLKASLKAAAERDGYSLSTWLLHAAIEKLERN